MGFKAWMLFANDPPATNTLVFATWDEADAYGKDLFYRWTAPTGYEVRTSDEPVNYTYIDGVAKRLPVVNQET